MPYIYEQTATRSNDAHWLSSNFDDYDTYINAGSAGELGKQRNMDQIGFWKKVTEHPAYDSFWSDQAVDRILAKEPLTVPTMLVASLWDQEDIYGAIAVYKALEPKDTKNDKLFLVLGPWHHGQEIEDASSLGAINFHSDTGLYFREEILAPFLAHYLKDDAPPLNTAPVTAFETGSNKWSGFRRGLRAVSVAARQHRRRYISKQTGSSHSQRPRVGRHLTNMFPIQPSQFPSARVQANPSATPQTCHGYAGLWTTSASSQGVRMS
jgi:predicted acyl esterase